MPTLLLLMSDAVHSAELLLCGQAEVFAIDVGAAERGEIEKLWSWRAKDRPELPEPFRKTFGTTDECKPVDGGAKVLISSSSGGCALVERASGRVLWYARVTNAHSLERLPRERVIVASSVGKEGNRLLLFDLDTLEKPIDQVPLPSAHGVVWDDRWQRLWAVGHDELHVYTLDAWDTDQPVLALEKTYPLPDPDGHDLQPVPGQPELLVTSQRHVYLFDRDRREFRLHAELGGQANGKSVSLDPETGRLAFICGQDGNWWSRQIGLVGPAGQIELTGERVYKARWLPARPLK